MIPIVAGLVDTSRGPSKDAGKVDRCGPGWLTSWFKGPRSSGGGLAKVVPIPATEESGEDDGDGDALGEGEVEGVAEGCEVELFVAVPPGGLVALAMADADGAGDGDGQPVTV
ncbi:MAG: hypothetical protein WBD38_11590 [Candidatus Dormiibacterota bacterium]